MAQIEELERDAYREQRNSELMSAGPWRRPSLREWLADATRNSN